VASGSGTIIKYYVHGVFMWISWAVIGLLQIWTNRYMRAHWRWNKVVHAILGFAALLFVLIAGFIALSVGGWTINSNSELHAKLGFSFFILGLVLMVGGIVANVTRLKIAMPWKTKQVLLLGKVHKWFGRSIVILSQFVIGTGALCLYEDNPELGWAVAGVSAGLFFVVLLSSEVLFQMKLKRDVPFEVPASRMSKSQFTNAIASGRKLVILDDMVLDVEKFID